MFERSTDLSTSITASFVLRYYIALIDDRNNPRMASVHVVENSNLLLKILRQVRYKLLY